MKHARQKVGTTACEPKPRRRCGPVVRFASPSSASKRPGQSSLYLRSKKGGVFKQALFLAVFLVAAITLSWMLFLPYAVASSLRKATGFQVRIESLASNPLGFDLRAENLKIGSNLGDPWLELAKIELTAESPIKASRREFQTLSIDADFLRLEIDERRLFNLARLMAGLQQFVDSDMGAIEVKEVRLRVGKLEIADMSGAIPRERTVAVGFSKGPYRARNLEEIISPILEQAARAGFRAPAPSSSDI